MTVIEARGLVKRFGPATAVDGLSFSVGAGTVTGFLGPNGAGKTTTLRMLLGLVQPTSGQALIWGRPYRELGERRKRVGAVLEASGIHPGRTVAGHLRIRCAATGTGRSRIGAVLEETGMSELAGRRAGSLSLGERQRLALAGALLGDPEVLILDEPANGLDPAGVQTISSIAENHRSVMLDANAAKLIRAPSRSAVQATRSSSSCPSGSPDSRSLTSCPVRPAASMRATGFRRISASPERDPPRRLSTAANSPGPWQCRSGSHHGPFGMRILIFSGPAGRDQPVVPVVAGRPADGSVRKR